MCDEEVLIVTNYVRMIKQTDKVFIIMVAKC